MLEIRTACEHCGKALPNSSREAMICSFECTYCENCAIELFQNVCPGCGGNFERRPVRPQKLLKKYPVSEHILVDPKSGPELWARIDKYKNIKPEER